MLHGHTLDSSYLKHIVGEARPRVARRSLLEADRVGLLLLVGVAVVLLAAVGMGMIIMELLVGCKNESDHKNLSMHVLM